MNPATCTTRAITTHDTRYSAVMRSNWLNPCAIDVVHPIFPDSARATVRASAPKVFVPNKKNMARSVFHAVTKPRTM